LQAGEFGVGLEPSIPAGEELLALALASEDAVQMAAMDAKVLCRDGRSRKANVRTCGLVWGGRHRAVREVE
jgi:hypothetical protein